MANEFTPSSSTNPCGVCNRGAAGAQKKGPDCRLMSDGRWLCHSELGEGLKPGDPPPTKAPYRFLRTSDEAQGFGVWKPEADWEERTTTSGSMPARLPKEWQQAAATSTRKTSPNTSKRTAMVEPQPLPITTAIQLARLPEPGELPPASLPNGKKIRFSATQYTEQVVDGEGNKAAKPRHQPRTGETVLSAGPDHWPFYGQNNATTYATRGGLWVLELEGPKCAMWAEAGGVVAISHPGHALALEALLRRYQELKAAGIAGVVYIADNDTTGQKKGLKLQAAATDADLPFLIIPASSIWPNKLPAGGSIDDAPGSAADRIAAIEQAIPKAAEKHNADIEDERPLTDSEKLALVRSRAEELIEAKVPVSDRLPLLRARSHSLKLFCKDPELQAFLWDARREAQGTLDLIKPGEKLDRTPTPWCWEGVLMAGRMNLIVGMPKTGKTSLMLSLIKAWHQGELAHLGHAIHGPCPPVLIVGTDQPEVDWTEMLDKAGLLLEDGSYAPPIIGMATANRPLHLDAKGIEKITGYAEQHPGMVCLLDTYGRCVGPLGLEERNANFADPMGDLMEAVSTHKITMLVNFHTSKSLAAANPSAASRGTTALPGMASQVVSLSHLHAQQDGGSPKGSTLKVVLKTEGRGGSPQNQLLEKLNPSGEWISHGSAEAVERARQLQEVKDNLTGLQEDALEAVGDRWAANQKRTTAADLVKHLGLAGKDADRSARRALQALAKKGLLSQKKETGLHGSTLVFAPADAGQESDTAGEPAEELRTPSRDIGKTASPASLASAATPISHTCMREEGCLPPVTEGEEGAGEGVATDAADAKDAKKAISREGVRSSPADLFSTTRPADPRWQPINTAGLVGGQTVMDPKGGTYKLDFLTAGGQWQSGTSTIPIGPGWFVWNPTPPPTPASTPQPDLPPVGTAIEIATAKGWKNGYLLEVASPDAAMVMLAPSDPAIGKRRVSRALAGLGKTWRAAA